MTRFIQFTVPASRIPPDALFSPDDTALVFDDPERPVGLIEGLLFEPRNSRPPEFERAMLGLARLHDSPEADRAWRAVRTGGVTGVRLEVGDIRTPDGQLVRGRALHRVVLIALDDAPNLQMRVTQTWEHEAASCS